MADSVLFDAISLDTFQGILARYQEKIPDTLQDLETQRLVVIPEALKSRSPQHITKTELETLMRWKLAHGKSRPRLQKLVESNNAMNVKGTTIEAFAMKLSPPPAVTELKPAIAKLNELKGVGPATATLLLSAKDSVNVPFFSDELYRWACTVSGKGPEQGWKAEIKYSENAYFEMYSKVTAFRQRMEKEYGAKLPALDIEKVAYVLGREADPPVPKRAKPKAIASSAPAKLSGAKGKVAANDEDQDDAGDEVQSVKPGRKRKAPAAEDEEAAASTDAASSHKKRGPKTALASG